MVHLLQLMNRHWHVTITQVHNLHHQGLLLVLYILNWPIFKLQNNIMSKFLDWENKFTPQMDKFKETLPLLTLSEADLVVSLQIIWWLLGF